ncbi:MAG: peptidase M28 [Terriglobia bacterium]|nr:MAG: peptidase M28 [Terriglobia bacterium]
MKRFGILLLSLVAAAALFAASAPDGKRWWSYIEALANDQMQGRDTGSESYRKAAQYVAAQFERDGLAAAGVQGYFQPVKFDARKIVEAESSLELIRNGKPEVLKFGDDAFINIRVDPADSVEAPLVFAGYGLTVPEAKYDDLAGLDLKGKIIVTLGGSPNSIPGPLRAHYQTNAERRPFLERAGVAGTVTIQNPHTADVPWGRTALSRFQESMTPAEQQFQDTRNLKISITVNPDRADKWLAGSGHTFAELLALADKGQPLPRFPLTATLRAKAKAVRRQVESPNVIAAFPGSDPNLKNEYVVLSAHLDHVGVGEPINGDRIYNGAMDDASGVATLLDIAQTLRDSQIKTRRSLLFVVVCGEEKGLQGSRFFAAHPTVERSRMVADINTDMFLPLYPFHLATVHGLNESTLGDTVREVAKPLGVEIQDDPAPQRNVFIRSDQYNFIRAGIPALKIDSGFKKGSREEAIEKAWLTERYHAPSDDLNQPVDLQAAAEYNRLILALARAVADNPARPQWKSDSFFRRFAQ